MTEQMAGVSKEDRYCHLHSIKNGEAVFHQLPFCSPEEIIMNGNENQNPGIPSTETKPSPELNAFPPPMPDDPPTITPGGSIKLKLLHDFDRFSTGSMVMRFADCNIEVKEGDETIGSMGSAMGGQMYIGHKKRLWAIDKQGLWEAVIAAEKEQYLAEQLNKVTG